MGGIFGGANKAARRQAEATLKAAEMEAASNREMAKAAQQTQESMLAQNRASQAASELLSRPMAQADVRLNTQAETAQVDPNTRKRRTVRSTFQAPRRSGISL